MVCEILKYPQTQILLLLYTFKGSILFLLIFDPYLVSIVDISIGHNVVITLSVDVQLVIIIVVVVDVVVHVDNYRQNIQCRR